MLQSSSYFEFFDFPPFSAVALQSFNCLEPDRYLQGDFIFRSRAFSTAIVGLGDITWCEQTSFFQSRELNNYAGGINRVFPPLSEVFRKQVISLILCERNKPFLLSSSYEIGVHQIRIVSEGRNLGYPVPEGPHQDGFDFVSIHCLNVFNVSGGLTSLLKDSEEGELVWKKSLRIGEGVMVNDRRLFHYTSPIKSVNGQAGFRDMCVITYNRLLSA